MNLRQIFLKIKLCDRCRAAKIPQLKKLISITISQPKKKLITQRKIPLFIE